MGNRLISRGVGAALVALGVGALLVMPSRADGPVKLYFHSANGGYDKDLTADRESVNTTRAPAGSTLSATAPAGTTDALARAAGNGGPASTPTVPTFSLPYTGPVTNVCYDIWVSAAVGASATAPVLSVKGYIYNGATQVTVPEARIPYTNTSTEAFHVTKLVTPTAPMNAAAGARFVIYTNNPDNPDWSLAYDSTAHPSSITFNADACPATGGGGGGSPTPSASGSGGPGPEESPSEDPCAAEIPGEGCQPVAAETVIEYTGGTTGRFGEVVGVRAKVTTETGATVPAGTVTFTGGSHKAVVEVDENGVARSKMPFDFGPAGRYPITVKYSGEELFQPSERQTLVAVTRMPAVCRLSRTVSGGRSVLTAAVVGLNNRPAVDQRVSFYYDGKGLTTVRTNSKGVARITATRGTAGHRFVAKMATNRYYEGCSDTVRV